MPSGFVDDLGGGGWSGGGGGSLPPAGGGSGGGPQLASSFGSSPGGTMSLAGLLAMRRRAGMSGGGSGGGQDDQSMPDLEHIQSLLAPIMAYAFGGTINEPVSGVGQNSGRRYLFGEAGPETVTPAGGGSATFDPLNTPAVGQPKVYNNAGASFYRDPSYQRGGGLWAGAGAGYRPQGPNDLLEELQRHLESQGLAEQGAASRAAAYYGANEGGGDPAMAGYAQLASLLGSEGRTASALSEAHLRRILGNDEFERQKQLARIQADAAKPGFDYGGVLGGVGSIIGAFT